MHVQAFVPDYETRLQDLDRFFDDATSVEERNSIIRKYGARYILVNRYVLDSEISESLESMGKVTYSNGWLFLIDLSKSAH
jgi:hypothetical protein